MKKMRELRNTVERLAVMHDRLGSRTSGRALRDLSEVMRDFDEQTVAGFVQRANGGRQERAKSKKRR